MTPTVGSALAVATTSAAVGATLGHLAVPLLGIPGSLTVNALVLLAGFEAGRRQGLLLAPVPVGSPRLRDAWTGAWVGALLFLLGGAGYVLSERVLHFARPSYALALAPQGLLDGAALAGAMALVVVGEELVFRGAILGALLSRSAGAAIVVSSLMFSLYHLVPYQYVSALAYGVVLAVLAHRSGRLWPAILAHAVLNVGGVVLSVVASPA